MVAPYCGLKVQRNKKQKGAHPGTQTVPEKEHFVIAVVSQWTSNSSWTLTNEFPGSFRLQP